MPTLPPEPPAGFTPPQRSWLQSLRNYVASLRPVQSFGTRTSHTSTGVAHETRPGQTTAPPSPSSGMNFRGEYDPGITDYVEGDVVVVRGGVSAGTYIALRDVPAGQQPAYPDVGIYWASLARSVAGVWG